MSIQELVYDLSKEPFNPQKNFDVAEEYNALNQTASAIAFYQRTAEYSANDNIELTYIALIKMALCFDKQGERKHTVITLLQHAISLFPERPEGYFFLSNIYEKSGEWHNCYIFASIGILHDVFDVSFPIEGYYGSYCLIFEKAVSAYWIGRKEESIKIFELLETMDLRPEYKKAVKLNLERIRQ